MSANPCGFTYKSGFICSKNKAWHKGRSHLWEASIPTRSLSRVARSSSTPHEEKP